MLQTSTTNAVYSTMLGTCAERATPRSILSQSTLGTDSSGKDNDLSETTVSTASSNSSSTNVEHHHVLSGLSRFGRNSDLQTLLQAYQRAMGQCDNVAVNSNSEGSLPAALIWGPSGTGKSSLVEHFVEVLRDDEQLYFIRGKHDENTGSSDPFSGIVQALQNLASQIRAGSADEINRLRKSIQQALGAEVNVMTSMVPALSILVDDSMSVASACEGSTAGASVESVGEAAFGLSNGSSNSAWNRLQYTFVQFIKALGTPEKPLILFLDDLQWTSQVTVDLLSTLLLDPTLKNVFFVGTIRLEVDHLKQQSGSSDQVLSLPPNAPVSIMLSELRSSGRDQMTNVHLSNFSSDETAQWLSQVLGRSILDVQALSQKLHSKTKGNLLFTIQALEALQTAHVLFYNPASSRWEWNWHASQSGPEFQLCDSVVLMVAKKLQLLPPEIRTILTLASYIRSSFDLEILDIVVKNFVLYSDFAECNNLVFNTEAGLESQLEKAVMEGFLQNTIGESSYRFAHDNIQQAARSLIPEGEDRIKLGFRIGKCLWQHCDDQQNVDGLQDHGLLFVAADHLNSIPFNDHNFLLNMNLQVGRKSSELAASASASSYLKLANDALNKLVEDPWNDEYDLTLRLYESRAEAELAGGNYDLGYQLGELVIKQAKSRSDTFKTYQSMVAAMGRQHRHDDSLRLAKKAAQLLGVYPKRSFLMHLAHGLMRTQKYFKKHTDEEFLQLPLNPDSQKVLGMQFMTQILVRSFKTKDITLFIVAVVKMIQLSIQSGLCEDTAMAVAGLGFVSVASGDYSAATRYANLARKILKRTGGKSLEGWVNFAASFGIEIWSKPRSHVSNQLKIASIASMEAGNFEGGAISCSASIMANFLGGHPVAQLAEEGDTLIGQMNALNVQCQKAMTVVFVRVTKQFAGLEALSWSEVQTFANGGFSAGADRYDTVGVAWAWLLIAPFFFKYELAEDLSKIFFKDGGDDVYFMQTTSAFSKGLMAAGRYRQTGKRKYLNILKRMRMKLKKWAVQNGPNSLHRSLILKAEELSLEVGRNTQLVLDAYDNAIAVGSKSNHTHETALCYELAGEFLVSIDARYEISSGYFTRALQMYLDWGGQAKVKELRSRRAQYISEARIQKATGKTMVGSIDCISTHDAQTFLSGGTCCICDSDQQSFDDDNMSVLTDQSHSDNIL